MIQEAVITAFPAPFDNERKLNGEELIFVIDAIGSYTEKRIIQQEFKKRFKKTLPDTLLKNYIYSPLYKTERAEAIKRYNERIEHIGMANSVKRLEEIDEMFNRIKEKLQNLDKMDGKELKIYLTGFMALLERAHKETQPIPGAVINGDVNITQNNIQIIEGLPLFIQQALSKGLIKTIENAQKLSEDYKTGRLTPAEIEASFNADGD